MYGTITQSRVTIRHSGVFILGAKLGEYVFKDVLVQYEGVLSDHFDDAADGLCCAGIGVIFDEDFDFLEQVPIESPRLVIEGLGVSAKLTWFWLLYAVVCE